MEVTAHPTRIVGRDDPGLDGERWFHAGLWLDVRVPEWDVRRRGHVHLVATARDPATWHRFDIGAHPLRPAEPDPASADGTPASVVTALETWLASWPMELHRHSGIGLVSDLGEGQVDFHRRVMSILRPELQRRLTAPEEAAGSRWPWRRRTAERERAERRDALAAGVAELGAAIETRTFGSIADAVRRVELGVLLTAPGLDLTRARTSRPAE